METIHKEESPTDSDLSLERSRDNEKEEQNQPALSGCPSTEGFYAAANFHSCRTSLTSARSSVYSRSNVGHQGRPYSLYQGRSVFKSLLNSSAERVLAKIKMRTISLEPLDSHSRRRMAPPALPQTPPLIPAKTTPRKLEPI